MPLKSMTKVRQAEQCGPERTRREFSSPMFHTREKQQIKRKGKKENLVRPSSVCVTFMLEHRKTSWHMPPKKGEHI
jgi:hypothetical protein